jgi:hypothetical protein
MEVRTGRWPVERVVSEIDALERELTSLLTTSPLRERADRPAVNRFLVGRYERHWHRAAP